MSSPRFISVLYYDLSTVHSVNYDGWVSSRVLDPFLHTCWFRGERFLLTETQLTELLHGRWCPWPPDKATGHKDTIDGVPWEIHAIEDPIARTAARRAWRSSADATHDIIVQVSKEHIFGSWFPCWAGVRTIRTWAPGMYQVTLSLQDDHPTFASIVASSRLDR